MIFALLWADPARAEAPAPHPAPTNASVEATADASAPPNGAFIDTDGRTVAQQPTFDAWFSNRIQKPHYGVAALEMAALLGSGTAYYWIRPSINKEDWDFQSWGQRIANLTPVFDNNSFRTNDVLHPVAGASYYLFARESQLTPFEAFAYSTGSSAVFEFVLEWLEKVSINDLIMTPVGGSPAGEFVYQLSEYLNSAPQPSTGQDIAKYSLGLPTVVAGFAQEPRRHAPLGTDNLGFSSAWWHRFSLAQGVGVIENDHHMSASFERFEGRGELVAMPGYQRPGTFATSFGQGNFTQARLRFELIPSGIMAVDSWFQMAMAGYYAQSYRATASGLQGMGGMVGYGMGWRYVDRDPMNQRDEFALAHLGGPVAQADFISGKWHARVFGDASADFGPIASLSIRKFAAEYGARGLKSVLDHRGYVFDYGASSRTGVELSYGGLTLGARTSLGSYRSIQGADREQATVTRDIPATDDIFELASWLGGSAPGVPIELRVEFDLLHRHSRLPPVVEERTDRSLTTSVGVNF